MTLSLHVRHEVTPERAYAVLRGLDDGEPIDYITQFERQLTRLRQLGLVEQDELTTLGNQILALCQVKPDLWGDLIHFLHYTLWDSATERSGGFSWTYQRFTNAAWELVEFELSPEIKDSIASSLINLADTDPDINVEALKKGAVSLSKDSIGGVVAWFRSLIPPVLENDHFRRRTFCHPELLLLATGYVAQTTQAELGVDMLLTPERRDAICRLCLLEPAALDRTLDWMLPTYPTVVVPGTSAGTYGRFLRFLKWPTMADLAAR